MNANDQFYARDAHVDAAAVAPLPNSRKVYVEGSRPDIRVPMREIAQADTPASLRRREESADRRLRHVGPVHRPGGARSTSARACRRCAHAWIAERGDTVELDGPTSGYGRARLADAALAGMRFDLAAQAAARAAPAPTSRRCTTRAAASSRRRWSSSPSARTCSARRC